MADEKAPEWKVIVTAQAKKRAELTDRLRAERLARDAAAPPAPQPQPKTRRAPRRAATRRG